jgi:hypothetical protein
MRILKLAAVAAAGMALLSAPATTARAGLVLTASGVGVQSSSASGITTETFNSIAAGAYTNTTLNTAVGTLTSTGTFNVQAADIYGGAGGTGNYFVFGLPSGSAAPVSLTLAPVTPASYLGFWWSAADSFNEVSLYSENTLVGYFNATTALGALVGGYLGNPNPGQSSPFVNAPYAYLNLYGTDGTTFDKVVFSNSNTVAGGFEVDNISLSSAPGPITGTVIPGGVTSTAVPEPSTLTAAGIGGVLMIGFARRRRSQLA